VSLYALLFPLNFSQKAWHQSQAFNFVKMAIDSFIALSEATIFDYRASFQCNGRAFYLQIFNDLHRVARTEHSAITIFYFHYFFL